MLEISRPVFEGAVDEVIEAIKKLQTLLGEVHDCDVWDSHLSAFLDAQRQRMASAPGSTGALQRVRAGLDYLRQDRAEARKHLFQQAVDHWHALRRSRAWEQLRPMVSGAAAAPPPEQPAGPPVRAPGAAGPGGNGQQPGRERMESSVPP